MAFEAAHQIGRQEGIHTTGRRLDNKPAKARQRQTARPALIDERGDARLHAHQVGIEPEAPRHVLIHMGMRFDQPGEHELPRHLQHCVAEAAHGASEYGFVVPRL